MFERLYLQRSGVQILVEWDEGHESGQVRLVVCDHADDARHANQLAASLHVPVQHDWAGMPPAAGTVAPPAGSGAT